ncbi:hypothetical protein D3C81_1827350 [compost metagenome]
MAFCGQVSDDVRLEGLQGAGHRLGVTDVGMDEAVAVAVGGGRQGTQQPRIGQLVKDQDFMIGVLNQSTHERRADEAGSAGDQNSH